MSCGAKTKEIFSAIFSKKNLLWGLGRDYVIEPTGRNNQPTRITMSKHTEIYGDRFGTLFVGTAPEGKVLDTVATERGMQIDLDVAQGEWSHSNPDADDETTISAYDLIGERLSQDSDWYDSNHVWIDA
jgi:hypothetical protein